MPKVNEATDTDLKIIEELKVLGWKPGDTLLYRQKYALTPEQQEIFEGRKYIEPDITLTDLNGNILSRNRLLAEAFQQMCYVQRAHQGTEILFSQLLHWGKGGPEYQTTEASVSLTIPTTIKDQAWVRFIVKSQERIQQQLEARQYLLLWNLRNLEIASAESLYETLSILFTKESLSAVLHDLAQKGMLKKKGQGRGTLYMLGKEYFSEGKKQGRATALLGLQRHEYESLAVSHIREHGPTSIGELIGANGLGLTRVQAGRILADLCNRGILQKLGNGRRWIKYAISQDSIHHESGEL